MELLPDFAYYRDEWRGTFDEKTFRAGVNAASSLVNELIGWNDVRTDRQKDCYKRAVCAALDAVETFGADMASVSIGGFSANMGAKSGRQIAMEDARGQLVNSGLLWGGIR